MSQSPTQPASKPASTGRSTPLAARGEPMVWLTGMALVIGVAMILGLLSMAVYQGMRSFWPRPIDRVTMTNESGQTEEFLGLPMRTETYTPPERERLLIEGLSEAGELPEGALDEDGRPMRRLYRLGNRDVGSEEPFRWVPLYRIDSVERAPDAVFVERQAWGPFVGTLEGVLIQETVDVAPDASGDVPAEVTELIDGIERRVEQEVLAENADGTLNVRRRIHIAETPEEAWDAFEQLHPGAVKLRKRIKGIERGPLGRKNSSLERQRLREKAAHLQHDRMQQWEKEGRTALSVPIWILILALTAGAFFGASVVRRRGRAPGSLGVSRDASLLSSVLMFIGLAGILFAGLEHPWSAPHMPDDRLDGVIESVEAERVATNQAIEEIEAQLRDLKAENDKLRVIIREHASGMMAPLRQTQPDEPLRMSDVVRMFKPGDLSLGGRLGVYGSRWWEFVSGSPREANTEGGIFPVIFGTVLLTLLLSIAVVPLGVIAALYMREYAKQGLLISIVRISVNNLAGVPSIVYGVFGLGFFCYAMGKYVDTGPSTELELGIPKWWLFLGLTFFIALMAIMCGLYTRPRPGAMATKGQRWGMALGGWLWAFAVIGALYVIATTPYFNGFFEAKGTGENAAPTFGDKGLLWSSLTLALLTLPVVIVATEEAIAAVPRTMREGSYGCGASHWQTIRRIVLPRAMPGIMTGMILAMARGAGEVAPLMLVGVVKQAGKLPFSGEFPFVHLERSFMHLGFHIYDVGFQSPDSEAAKPLVWTTTLLLILIVLTLNIAAIRIRAGLRKKFVGGAF